MVGSAGAKASLRVPALVWEAPTKSSSDSGHWMITDAGQSLRRPRTGEPLVMLAGGAEIKLGDVLLRFMLPDALLAFVDEALRR
jgi:hypothetical protein